MPSGVNHLRIVSLLPSATEIIYAVGAGPYVVGTTHECDYPPEALNLPDCTANLLPPGLSASEIDTAVAATLKEDEHSIYRLNSQLVTSLNPSVIVTQKLCAVCAVPETTVQSLACTFGTTCKVISSDPHNLPQLMDSIIDIGRAVNHGKEAADLVIQLKARLSKVTSIFSTLEYRPKVMVIEWPDPIYAPGHWVPDMIQTAGGECILGKSGEKSRRVAWDELNQLEIDVIVCAFCGYDLKRNEEEWTKVRLQEKWANLARNKKVFATNASAYFSRPGNRLVDGTELLAFLLHGISEFTPSKGSASILIDEDGSWKDLGCK